MAVLIGAVAGLALFPWLGESFYVKLVVSLMILGIFAMSLDLLIGFTGLVSFGHAAFFGLSGYLLAIVTPQDGTVAIWYALPLCLAGTALAALVIGWFSVRTSGIYFIMITLAFAQMLYYFFNENQALGGSDGIFIYFRPTVAVGSLRLIDLDDDLAFYYVVLASLVGAFLLLSMVLRAPFGQVIRGIRTNEPRTRALGFATQRYKLASFVIAGTLAGYAGFLEAIRTGIMSPAHLGWHESGLVMMVVILGGMGTLYGPVLGAFAIGLFQDFVQDLAKYSPIFEYWHLFLGAFVIAVVLFLPDGIAGLVARLAGRAPAGRPAAARAAPEAGRKAAS
jgi:branched-chain amino acid transport system permease protein